MQKKLEKPPSFSDGDGDNVVVLDDTFYGLGGEAEEEDPSYYDEEEENNDEDMADQYLDQMTQGPLALSCLLHKMLRHLEKLLRRYDPDKAVKAEDHLNNFYLHQDE